MKKYAVIGNPIDHSWSPFIHQHFASQTQIDLDYHALKLVCASLEDFEQTLNQLCNDGYQGLNVTLPYKQWAFELIEKQNGLMAAAKKAGSVNTINFSDKNNWLGDNTDGIGLIRDIIKNLRWSLKKNNLLILGAGGAAHGVIAALINEDPACIHILNRDPIKAEKLANRFSQTKCDISIINPPLNTPYHLIINATSSSLWQQLPETIAHLDPKNAYCYDMVYGSMSTPFLHWALANNARAVSDGLGMLVEQAAASFYQWHQKMPNTQSVIKELRQRL